jgi:stage II sporulation protein R
MKSKLSKILIMIFLLLFFIFISAKSYATCISKDLTENIFRLHIIANSNSQEDQALKLKIRDEIISYMKAKTSDCTSKTEIIETTQNILPVLKQIAQNTIYENGYDYDVSVEIGNFYFPTKYYGNISMPAGNYDAIRIKLGKAEGQNWWCSLFPSLCFTDVSTGIIDENADTNLKENLEEEEYNLLTKTSPNIKIKFKLLELFN